MHHNSSRISVFVVLLIFFICCCYSIHNSQRRGLIQLTGEKIRTNLNDVSPILPYKKASTNTIFLKIVSWKRKTRSFLLGWPIDTEEMAVHSEKLFEKIQKTTTIVSILSAIGSAEMAGSWRSVQQIMWRERCFWAINGTTRVGVCAQIVCYRHRKRLTTLQESKSSVE